MIVSIPDLCRLSYFCLFPLIISVITNCINFWMITVLSCSDSLILQAYKEHFNNRSMESMWLSFVKNILTDLAFSHVWNNQGTLNTSSLITCIKANCSYRELFISLMTRKEEKVLKPLGIYVNAYNIS